MSRSEYNVWRVVSPSEDAYRNAMVDKSEMQSSRGKSQRDFLTGQLLIAMPNMSDPRFERSVLLVCFHDADHAMAVIVNKPVEELELGELLERLEIDPKESVGGEPVFFGGPVQMERGSVLHSLDYRLDCTIEISPGVGLTASKEILVDIAGHRGERTPPAQFLVAVGYAGWSAGQLESELTANAWAHCDADESIIFAANSDESWRRALEKIGVTGAKLSSEWMSARPSDAPLN